MKAIKKSLSLLIAITLINVMGMITNIDSLAASATITFSSEQTSVEKGENVTVTISIKSSVSIGDVETFITYDSNVLEYVEGSQQITGGDGHLKLLDNNRVIFEKTKKYTMRFKAKEIGTSEFSIRDNASIYDYEEELEMSVASSKLSISVKPSKEASKDNQLSSLKVANYSLNPEFATNILKYEININEDVSDLIISAVANDVNAKVNVEGNKGLTSGTNTVLITVQAESGEIKEYIINVIKSEESKPEETTVTANTGDEELPTQDITNQEIDYENDVKVSIEDDNTIIQGNYYYRIIPLEDLSLLPEGYVENKRIIESMEITVYQKESIENNNFILIYAINKYGEKGLYQYDIYEKTIQRFIKTDTSKNETPQGLRSEKEFKELQTNYSMYIGILLAVCILLSIIVINLFLKTRGFKDDNYE